MDNGIIIGAGPAGLSLGRALQTRNIPFVVLEQGPVVGHTFRTMAANTSFGPWLNNTLAGGRIPWRGYLSRVNREQYAQYLSEYAISHDLPCLTGVRVERVSKRDGRFYVETATETLEASFVVNATGYFSNPFVPRYPGAERCLIPQIHACRYREPNTVRELLGSNRGRILIVGKRLTAGETMESLVRAGYEVALSHRSPIQFGPSEVLEACLSPFTFAWEELRVRLPRAETPWNLDVKMRGGKQRALLASGKVAAYPDIASLTERTVVFADGREAPFDLIIYATGYLPALNHLAGLLDLGQPLRLDGMQSADVPGLFFLGLRGLRSFRSQFLRGIRSDAPVLARQIERYVRSLELQPGPPKVEVPVHA